MPEGIGFDIAGPPEASEDDNVFKWKEFLSRPENLATALVLATGITGEKRRGQSNTNKAFQSGLAALGFRGGLEAGVEGQRSALRTEERTATRQAEDIVAQQQRTVNEGRLADNSAANAAANTRSAAAQEANAATNQSRLTTPTALNPSEIELNEARANALNATAQPERIRDFVETFVEAEIERAAQFGEEPDLSSAVTKGAKMNAFQKLREEGKVDLTTGMITLSAEDAQMLQDVGLSVPEEEAPDAVIITPTDNLRKSGAPLSSISGEASAEVDAVRKMRRVSGFEELSDDTILDRVAEARELARNKEKLKQMSEDALAALIGDYARVFSLEESRNVRGTLSKKKGTTSESSRLDLSGDFL